MSGPRTCSTFITTIPTSWVLSLSRQSINSNPHPRPGQTPQLCERGLPAALQPPLEAVLHEDPLQAAGAEHRDPVASGEPELELSSRLTGYRIPFPQDSAYWPLWPMRVATLWLALDDVTEENGAMEMFRFSDVPQTRNQNLNVTMVEETGADFFIKINQDVLDNLPSDKKVKMTLSRGQAEFHDAYILHRSMQNRSSK